MSEMKKKEKKKMKTLQSWRILFLNQINVYSHFK